MYTLSYFYTRIFKINTIINILQNFLTENDFLQHIIHKMCIKIIKFSQTKKALTIICECQKVIIYA